MFGKNELDPNEYYTPRLGHRLEDVKQILSTAGSKWESLLNSNRILTTANSPNSRVGIDIKSNFDKLQSEFSKLSATDRVKTAQDYYYLIEK